MLRNITLLTLFVIPILAGAQIKILESSTDNINSDGEVFDVSGNPASFEFVKYLHVVNESAGILMIKVRRTELDVLPGTENATCWYVCPDPIGAGSQVVQVSPLSETIAAGDTNASFSAHYYLNGLDGCSMFLYEWVDAADYNIVYASVTVKFLHNIATSCSVGVEEVNEDVSFSISPNPASHNLNISLSGFNDVGEVSIEIYDMLGKKVSSISQVEPKNNLNVSGFKNGMYFISIMKNGSLIKTSKFIKE